METSALKPTVDHSKVAARYYKMEKELSDEEVEQFFSELSKELERKFSNKIERLAYSIMEAGQAIGISERSFRNRMGREIPYIRFGGRILIRVATLDETLKKMEIYD